VLNAPDDTEVLVLEMGMRGFGEISRLCRIAPPRIGVVTRVAEAHSDRVGGIEGVARAKSELVEALPSTGIAVLNADDDRVRAMAERCAGSVLLFGEAADADVRIERIELDGLARAAFSVSTPWGAVEVRLGVSGRHMAANAAAALAVVGAVGGDVAAGAAALSEVRLTAMRMEVLRSARGVLVLNDSYNANPTSMRAALDALAAIPAGRRVAVLGVMAEISDPEVEHPAILRYAVERGIEVLAHGTDLYGITPSDDPVGAVGSLAGGDAVLVKASRAAGLERIAASLVDAFGGLVGEG
jgi:UDP-N-acetylmuramoyl-tripeptide--D-alanyl-D-alanine ligase